MKLSAIVLCCLSAGLTPSVAFGTAAQSASVQRPVTVKYLTPGARVLAMASDRRRFFWFGTEDGLVRYDGFSIEPLRGPNMPTSSIFALCAATDGSLWIGTRGTKALRRLKEGELAASTIQLPEGVTHVWAIVQRADEFFVGTNLGLFRVGLDLIAVPVDLTPLPKGKVSALLVARDQSLWIAHQNGVVRLASHGLSVVNTMPFPLVLVQDPQGRIWAVHHNLHAVLVYDESGKEVTRFKSSPTKAMLADMDGTVWVATENGVWHANGLSAPVNLELELSFDQRVESLARDADGTLWLGTASHGAIQIDTQPAVRLLPPSAPAFGFSVTEDVHKVIWLSTADSLLRFEGQEKNVLAYGPATGLPFDVRSVSPAAGGGIWAASTSRGVFHVNGKPDKSWVVKQVYPRGVRAIFDDNKNTVWFGWEDGGLSRASNGGAPIPVPLGMDIKILAIEAAKGGGLWLASWGQLVRLFDDGRTRIISTGTGGIFSVAELPNDVLCFGTSAGGLDCMQDDGRFHYGAEEGVSDDKVGSIVVDRFGAIWLGTTNGIIRLNELPDRRRKYISTQRLGLSSGLRSVECAHGYANAARVLSDGSLVFATTHAAAVVDPQRLAAKKAPPVVIDQMVLNGETKRIASGHMNFATGDGNLEIRYAAPRFTGIEPLQFYYRLEGQDKDWVKAGTRRVAIYTNLVPGYYRFLVKTEGAPPHPPAAITFRLVPPLHKTPAFAIVVFCSAIAALLLVTRFSRRQRRLRRADILSERRRLARDLHDTVEQTVFAVRLQLDSAIQELAAESPSASDASARVERAFDLLGEASVEMRSAIHALRAPDMKDRDLSLEISQAAARVLRGSNTKFHMNSLQPLPGLAMDEHQQIFNIVSEAMTNAVKHGAANNLHVTLASPGGGLEIKVRDDGGGFDTRAPPPFAHYGLMGMRERAQTIGATLTINAVAGAGTAVTITLPPAEGRGRGQKNV